MSRLLLTSHNHYLKNRIEKNVRMISKTQTAIFFCLLIFLLPSCKQAMVDLELTGTSYKSQMAPVEVFFNKIKYRKARISIGDELIFTSDSTCTFSSCSGIEHLCRYEVKGEKMTITSLDGTTGFFAPQDVRISEDELFSVTTYEGAPFVRKFHRVKKETKLNTIL
jgi:hypothetical protein